MSFGINPKMAGGHIYVEMSFGINPKMAGGHIYVEMSFGINPKMAEGFQPTRPIAQRPKRVIRWARFAIRHTQRSAFLESRGLWARRQGPKTDLSMIERSYEKPSLCCEVCFLPVTYVQLFELNLYTNMATMNPIPVHGSAL